MMQGATKPGGMKRPQTAATTNVYDESRIKDKLKYLENIEMSIEDDINKLRETDFDAKKEKKKTEGKRLTKKMILEAAMCDDLDEV